MSATKLRFKGFEFDYNPRTFTIKHNRNVIEFLSPLSGSLVQDLGEHACVVTGEGEFFGENAMTQYEKLYRILSVSASGLLHIPNYKPFYATLTSLSITAKPMPNVLQYKFRFIENKRGLTI